MFAWQNNLFSFQYLFLKRLYTSDKDEGHDEEMAKCLRSYNRGALNMTMAKNPWLRRWPSLWDPSLLYFFIGFCWSIKLTREYCPYAAARESPAGWLRGDICCSAPIHLSGQDMGDLRKWGGGLASSSGCDSSKARAEVIPRPLTRWSGL